MRICLHTVAKAIFSTKPGLRTPTARHRKTGPEQTLNILSDIKMIIHADSKSLKPKELTISLSKYKIYKSTKPFSITLNRYNFFNQILSLKSKTTITTTIQRTSLKSKTTITTTIQRTSFRYPLRPILRLRTIHTTLKKRSTLLRTPLRTVQIHLQTKASIQHRKAQKSRKNY